MWNHFAIVNAFKYACEERETISKPMSAIFRDYFLCGMIHFVNTITVKRALAAELVLITYIKFIMKIAVHEKIQMTFPSKLLGQF